MKACFALNEKSCLMVNVYCFYNKLRQLYCSLVTNVLHPTYSKSSLLLVTSNIYCILCETCLLLQYVGGRPESPALYTQQPIRHNICYKKHKKSITRNTTVYITNITEAYCRLEGEHVVTML